MPGREVTDRVFKCVQKIAVVSFAPGSNPLRPHRLFITFVTDMVPLYSTGVVLRPRF